MKQRLDQALVQRNMVRSRSQAESWIRLGKVSVDGAIVTKSGTFVGENARIELLAKEQYVSRAGLKLASVVNTFSVQFRDAVVLDVGSSTGGFTDYALQHGARKVIAIDVGTEQLHPSLRGNKQIELHEKTDIRDVAPHMAPSSFSASSESLHGSSLKIAHARPHATSRQATVLKDRVDIIVIDVSFISLREILPHIASLANTETRVIAMVKPQFEAGRHQVNKGVIKNDAMRRQILHDFELWVRRYFVISDKRDSDVAGAKGNRERFYLLKTVS